MMVGGGVNRTNKPPVNNPRSVNRPGANMASAKRSGSRNGEMEDEDQHMRGAAGRSGSANRRQSAAAQAYNSGSLGAAKNGLGRGLAKPNS